MNGSIVIQKTDTVESYILKYCFFKKLLFSTISDNVFTICSDRFGLLTLVYRPTTPQNFYFVKLLNISLRISNVCFEWYSLLYQFFLDSFFPRHPTVCHSFWNPPWSIYIAQIFLNLLASTSLWSITIPTMHTCLLL